MMHLMYESSCLIFWPLCNRDSGLVAFCMLFSSLLAMAIYELFNLDAANDRDDGATAQICSDMKRLKTKQMVKN